MVICYDGRNRRRCLGRGVVLPSIGWNLDIMELTLLNLMFYLSSLATSALLPSIKHVKFMLVILLKLEDVDCLIAIVT